MKKIFISLLALFAVTLVNAQEANEQVDVKAQIAKSEKRCAELADLCEKLKKESGNEEVDDYAAAVVVAATASMVNSENLENFYYREIGETKDGITDVNIKKPTLEEWVALGAGIAAEATSISAVSNKTEAAVKAAKSQKNPMKAAKIMKHCETSTKALKILTEESVESAKAVNQIIETLKSGKNL